MHNPFEPVDPDNSPDPARRSFLSLAAIVPALAATAGIARAAEPAPGGELPRDLAKAVHDYDQATFHNDTAALDSLVAEDYLLVNSDSTLQNKKEYLDDFRVPGFRLDPYVMQQPLQKVWENTALTGGLLPLRWTQDGALQSRLLRVAHVWARQEGRWQLIYTQLTRVPQEVSR